MQHFRSNTRLIPCLQQGVPQRDEAITQFRITFHHHIRTNSAPAAPTQSPIRNKAEHSVTKSKRKRGDTERIIPPNDLGEGLEVGLDHLLAGRLGVGELHGDEPVVVVAALEEDLVGGDLGVVGPVVVPAPRRRRGRGTEPGGAAGEEPPRRPRRERLRRRGGGGGRREGEGPGDEAGRAEEGRRCGGGGGEGPPETQREGHDCGG